MRLRSDLPGIAAFVETVNSNSFTAAGERLGVSKSAIGKSVARLEARIGVRLLERTTRSLSLTDEGRSYFERCVGILSDLEEAESALTAHRQAVIGRLRVNLSVSFGRRWIMPILAQLAHDNPQLSLDVSFTDRHVDLIEEGFDLVVRLGDPGDHTSLIGRSLGRHQAVLCASPSYLAARGTPQTMLELSSHDCIGFGVGERSFASLLPGHVAPGSTRIVPRHIVNDGEALRQAVISGLGISYLPTWMVSDELKSGQLIPVIDARPLVVGPITALWPKSRTTLPKVRASIDALVAQLLPVPPWQW